MDHPARRFARAKVIAALLLLAAFAGFVQSPFLTFYRISGNSMLPALRDGDRVLVTAVPGIAGGIELGDTVIAEVGGEILIKRVAGVPGDHVDLRNGELRVNGVSADDPIRGAARDHSTVRFGHLDDDQYLLLGDNRRVSVDSRIFGPVSRGQILGKVVYRFESGQGRVVTAAERP